MTTATLISTQSSSFSLEDWLQNPPEHTERINRELVEKKNMTLKHSRIQVKIETYWHNYVESTQQGGEVYTEVPCRTYKGGDTEVVVAEKPSCLGFCPCSFKEAA